MKKLSLILNILASLITLFIILIAVLVVIVDTIGVSYSFKPITIIVLAILGFSIIFAWIKYKRKKYKFLIYFSLLLIIVNSLLIYITISPEEVVNPFNEKYHGSNMVTAPSLENIQRSSTSTK